MESERIARIRNAECPGRGALDLLEAMLRFKKAKSLETAALKKWRGGMLGEQLWDYMFEMDVYLRLVRAGADVETDVKIPKAGESGMAEIDLRVDGCLAEAYAPLDREILVHSNVTSIEDPGTRMMKAIQDKCQLGHVGKSRTAVIAKCSGGDFGNVVALRTKLRLLLRSRGQPGAVFFVGQDGDRSNVECLVNSRAVAAVPKQTVRTILGALELDAL